VLLVVIFSFDSVPDSQTGFEPGISQNNSAVFSRICAILGVGNFHGKIVSDGEVVQVQEQGLSLVLWGFQFPKTALCKPGKTPGKNAGQNLP